MPHSKADIAKAIKKLALEKGFTDCGITPATFLKEDSQRLRQWLDNGMHAGMGYMENHFDKRCDPSRLVPGAKSVVVLLLNYYPKELQNPNTYQIAKYAYGKDYHDVMKQMLQELLLHISEEIAPTEGRVFVDSAPVLERSLAARAGLGWIGKNGNLISPKYGSYFFIGELIIDLDMDYDQPIRDFCGSCSRCIHQCPTQAIPEPAVIDSRKCISYWTIEHKGDIDLEVSKQLSGRIFGCDICQDVCPWNKKAVANPKEEFQGSEILLGQTNKTFTDLTLEGFQLMFRKSAVKRCKYDGLMRNIQAQK